MPGHSTIPPKFVPDDEAWICDPAHPDYDPDVHEAVKAEAVEDLTAEDDVDESEHARNMELLNVLAEIAQDKRGASSRCICPEVASQSAFQQTYYIGDVGVYEDTLTDDDNRFGYKAIVDDNPEESAEEPIRDAKLDADDASTVVAYQRLELTKKMRKGDFSDLTPEQLLELAKNPQRLQALVTRITGILPEGVAKRDDALKTTRRVALFDIIASSNEPTSEGTFFVDGDGDEEDRI